MFRLFKTGEKSGGFSTTVMGASIFAASARPLARPSANLAWGGIPDLPPITLKTQSAEHMLAQP